MILLLAAGCASEPKIHSMGDPSADLGRYHSYSMMRVKAGPGMSQAVVDMVGTSIDRSLLRRGFSKTPPADFAVAYTLSRRDSIQVSQFGHSYGWGPSYHDVDVRNITEGTLIIDVFDVATRRGVWHGVATQQITPGQTDTAKIDAIVDAVLDRLRPVPGAANGQ
jgi:hypothetical protein